MINYDMYRLKAISKNYEYIRFALETADDLSKVTDYMKQLGLTWYIRETLERRPFRRWDAIYIRCESILKDDYACLIKSSVYNNLPMACYDVDLTKLFTNYKVKRGDL